MVARARGRAAFGVSRLVSALENKSAGIFVRVTNLRLRDRHQLTNRVVFFSTTAASTWR